MSKRLQVIIEEDEYQELQKHARQARMSLGEWVRQALRKISKEGSTRPANERLKALEKSLQHTSPVGDIEQLNAEIIEGYFKGQ